MEEPLPAPPADTRDADPPHASTTPAERLSLLVERERVARKGPAGSLDERMASLSGALRRARLENAERSAAIFDLRAAEIARLEMLGEALSPVLAQVPRDCDIFDVGVAPAERPRLFIDQIGFVEMDRDRRTYRFLQDTRHGRVTLRESDSIDDLVEAITSYIAHRLIEREKALAVDYASGGAAQALGVKVAAARERANARESDKSVSGKTTRAAAFIAEFFGATAFFAFLAVLAAWIYRAYLAG
ncbi:hypothetical protein HUN39_09740 [Methylocystis sp. FS]|uniref:hypothetical protein n=1 Tax=Methylocystis silviterrae TaxID=2743612 RepID=UPI0015841CED|nr:hypothetical protein [Methylocystis silviterrae]NUJ80309.1 hypothetical protein [Methylocystis silviterrae]